jgi:chromosome segregation ATPase
LTIELSTCIPTGGARKRGHRTSKKHIANNFAEWMKRTEEELEQFKQKTDETGGEDLEERLSDLESKLEDVEFNLEELEELDSKHEELSEKVEDLEGELAVANSRIDDLESEVQ